MIDSVTDTYNIFLLHNHYDYEICCSKFLLFIYIIICYQRIIACSVYLKEHSYERYYWFDSRYAEQVMIKLRDSILSSIITK